MNITVRDLLDAGVHIGHQTRRWNPRSKPFVFDHRQGVSIIDITKTHGLLEKAYEFVENLVASGKSILLVGTKRQAQDIIREMAASTSMPFCANRWLGGALTNHETIKRSIAKYKKYQAMELDGSLAKLPKKESSAIKREMNRMMRNFEGMVGMNGLPGGMFVIDIKHEDIAVKEARRLGIPVIALVDTNSDPNLVEYPIPGNHGGIKSIRLIAETILEAIQSGLAQRESRTSPSIAQAETYLTETVADFSEEDLESAPAVESPLPDVEDIDEVDELELEAKASAKPKKALPVEEIDEEES